MMNYIVIAFLFLSIVLYIILGGADFGAGILELFTSAKNRSRTRKTLYMAIGPIWEANHMWLIIAIVILFVGFPAIYTEMSTSLHIPLICMLIGIIARGTAFVFRHYDAVKDDMQKVYNRVYALSSIVTPLFLGIIAGSVLSGHIDINANTFSERYMHSWLNWFSVGVGFFVVALCGFLASVYLIGEADNAEDRQRFVNKARRMNIAAVICGALVFIAASLDHIPLLQWIFYSPVGLTAVIAATGSLAIMWYLILYRNKSLIIRPFVAFQVVMILLAISYAHFPDVIIIRGGENLSLFNTMAPNKTMDALGWALILGSIFILPALFYLYYSFQKHEEVPL
ncbi:MAG TPA: cytochrome d ubiquinol oxidase subunit II [Cyclobacteriaceae bacterium]|jgi:cytochrome d ubiquinol oxidase subunit II|nr:cytochrome d ubiquinol oxidase subunit II [Cyclobacteriaceae bacterium]